jgi:diguanylate cyclase (GGDEF)-like protein
VIEREAAGFSAREIVQEFLLLRRVMWRFVQTHVDPTLDARAVLRLEDLLNSILDEVIAECTVIYFDRATQELSERSRRDSLTGLLNHQAFNTRLDEELDRATRYGHELQVIYFDCDEFKHINDALGHAEGDRALVGIARLIMESIRESDFAGRIGGDEFVIALVESEDLAAQLLLDRLRARIAHAAAEDIVPTGTAISAGCAGYPREADCAQDLLVLADRRMYDDKRARKLQAGASGSATRELLGPEPEGAPEPPPTPDLAPRHALAAAIEPSGASVVIDVAKAASSEPSETDRIVEQARAAIEAARRQAER